MNKYVLPAIALLVITGCSSTTPKNMRDSSPDAVHSSAKSPREIAICIAEKWEESGTVNQRESKLGYSVSKTTNGYLHYLVDIERKDTFSITKAYKFGVISFGSDPSLDAVSNCQL